MTLAKWWHRELNDNNRHLAKGLKWWHLHVLSMWRTRMRGEEMVDVQVGFEINIDGNWTN